MSGELMIVRIKITDIPVEGRRQLLRSLQPVLNHDVVNGGFLVSEYANFWYLTKGQSFGSNPDTVFITYSHQAHPADKYVDAGDFL